MKFALRQKLLPVEWVTLAYTLFTSLLVLLLWRDMADPMRLLTGRALVVAGMALMYLIYCLRPCNPTLLLRQLYPLTLLGYWYPDTYEFCQLFPNLDHLFAATDAWLFGCQPAGCQDAPEGRGRRWQQGPWCWREAEESSGRGRSGRRASAR